MKRVKLESSAISSVRYDARKRTLEVDFRNGDGYRYFHVPEFVYRELLAAESAGAFWNQVKANYEFICLERKDNGRKEKAQHFD